MGNSVLPTAWPGEFPELATERVRLRAPLPRDATALLGILGDPEVTRHHNMPTLATVAEAQAALERLERRYAARDTIRWAIELLGHDEMIGTAGLLRFDFEHGHAEVGYEMARRWWGRGLTSEAVGAIIRYGFSVLGLHRIEAGVLPGNDASVQVLEKLGFREEGTRRDYLFVKGRFHSFRWFSLLETDELLGRSEGGRAPLATGLRSCLPSGQEARASPAPGAEHLTVGRPLGAMGPNTPTGSG